MTKRQPTKKEPKMKQKQKQQQNVIVNIGTTKPAPKKRGRKPKAPPKQDAKQEPVIITRGPNTFYQQPQPQQQSIVQPPQQPQHNINDIFRLIRQQQAPTPEPASIIPPPIAEEAPKQENDLEKVRKARRAKFEKPALERAIEQSALTQAEEESTRLGLKAFEPKQSSLITAIEEENKGLGLEDKAYQDFQQVRDLTALFRQAEQKEAQTSLLGEPAPAPSVNFEQPERIATKESATPLLALEESELLATPKTKGLGLNFASVIQGRRGLFSGLSTKERADEFNTQTKERYPDQLRGKSPLPPVKTSKSPFFVSESDPLSLLSVIEQSNAQLPDILQGGEVSIPTKDDPIAQELELGFALNTPVTYGPISELNLGEQQAEEPPPPPQQEVYEGGEFLPPIIQPVETKPIIEQLLAPRAEPSLIASVEGEARAPDELVTEQLVKGAPKAEPETRTPSQRLIAFVRQLNEDKKQEIESRGEKYSSKTDGIKYSHLGYEQIVRNIQTKKGPDFVIPDFAVDAKPRGRKASKAEVDIDAEL